MIYTYDNLGANGRLGNQLWQLASTMGIANDRTGSHLNARFPDWFYRPWFSLPDELFNPANDEVCDLGLDYLQHFSYINSILPQIREYFKPSQVVNLSESYPWFFSLEHKTAIHVRRGDSIGKEQWHPLVTEDYYRDAMELILKETPETTFIVFSDDEDWCRASGWFPYPNTLFASPPTWRVTHAANAPNPGDHEEIFLMALCDKHIIANSTFSYWGALLSNNPYVINPKVWYGPLLNGWDHMVFIPNEWITLG